MQTIEELADQLRQRGIMVEEVDEPPTPPPPPPPPPPPQFEAAAPPPPPEPLSPDPHVLMAAAGRIQSQDFVEGAGRVREVSDEMAFAEAKKLGLHGGGAANQLLVILATILVIGCWAG